MKPTRHRRQTRRSTTTKRTPRRRQVLDRLVLHPGVDREPDGLIRARSTARVAVLGVLVLLGYGGLVARAADLMLLPDDRIEQKAAGQFEEAVIERGRRGNIVDRNGTILASTVDLQALHVDPSLLSDDGRRRLARGIATQLDQDADQLLARLMRPGRRDVRLARALQPDETAALRAPFAEDVEVDNALFVRRDPRRLYPGREDGAALLGVVGQLGIGLAGLERSLDAELSGDTVKYVQWRDRKGRRITLDRPEALPGNDVVLTIDDRIQHVTEQALRKARENTGATAASAVVVEVKSGEILAMASVPGINPNDQSKLDITRLKNRAAMDAVEPGSVFKPFTVSATLDYGLMDTDDLIDCEKGAWRIGRKTIRDEHRLGMSTLGEIIKYSSNICAAKLALALGPERELGTLSDFGFGRSTGLGLPGETRGLLRKPDGIRKIELATTGYGYGASASAVQLAAAAATLGNGGVRMQPLLVKEIRDRHGELVSRNEARVDRRVVSEETARAVVDMMVAVTEKGGTGTRAAVPGYRVAGKTGTAKKLVDGVYSPTERVGSWIGIIPADDPVLAIAVMVDGPTIGPRFGGWTAGPAFKDIASDSMRILGIDPDPALLDDDDAPDRPGIASDSSATPPPADPPPPALAWAADGRLVLPDMSGLSLRQALVTLQGAGLAMQVQGSGRVADQLPPAGTPLSPGTPVQLVLR